MGAVAKDDNLVILNFSGTDGDFQFATEEERAENVNIGISVQKGNTALKDAINTVLSAMTEDDFNALMDQAIAIQPESLSPRRNTESHTRHPAPLGLEVPVLFMQRSGCSHGETDGAGPGRGGHCGAEYWDPMLPAAASRTP